MTISTQIVLTIIFKHKYTQKNSQNINDTEVQVELWLSTSLMRDSIFSTISVAWALFSLAIVVSWFIIGLELKVSTSSAEAYWSINRSPAIISQLQLVDLPSSHPSKSRPIEAPFAWYLLTCHARELSCRYSEWWRDRHFLYFKVLFSCATSSLVLEVHKDGCLLWTSGTGWLAVAVICQMG